MRILLTFLAVFLNAGITDARNDDFNYDAVLRHAGSDTVFVGWIDLRYLNVADFDDYLRKFEDPSAPGGDYSQEEAVQQLLVEMGVTRIYLLSALDEPAELQPQFVIPIEKANECATLLTSLLEGGGSQIAVDGASVLVVGPEESLDAIRTPNGIANPGLARALNAAKGPHGIVMANSADTTTSLSRLAIPLLPNQDADNIKTYYQFFESIQWASLSGELPPTQATLLAETGSTQQSEELAALLNGAAPFAWAAQFKTEDERILLTTAALEQSNAVVKAIIKMVQKPDAEPEAKLKQLGLAMHNYHDVYGHLPPQALVNAAGQRLLSWRVLLLPFLEQQNLYNEFRLDEPWDSPHNLKFANIVPICYASEGVAKAGPYKTRFIAPLTPDSVFGKPGKAAEFKDVSDGLSNTFWIVEAAPEHAVVWTKPDDLKIDLESIMNSIVGTDAVGFFAGFGDGSVRFIARQLADNEKLKAMLSRDGGEAFRVE